MIADGQPGVGPGNHKPADNQHHRIILQRKQGTEHHRHQRGKNDLPLILKPVDKAGAEQAAQRVGESDKKGVQQAVGNARPLAGKQRRQPVAEAKKADRLKEIHHHQHEGSSAVFRRPDLFKGSTFALRFPGVRDMLRRRRDATAPLHLTHHRVRIRMATFHLQPAGRLRQFFADDPNDQRTQCAKDNHPAPAAQAE